MREFADLTDAAARGATWVRGYNLERVHEVLGVCSYPRAATSDVWREVLAAIERGQPVGASASIADGVLDLFRVNYVGGKPELWLLGKVHQQSDNSKKFGGWHDCIYGRIFGRWPERAAMTTKISWRC